MPHHTSLSRAVLGSIFILLVCASAAQADTIRANTMGTLSGISGYWGESVVTTTGNGNGWNNLAFNFFNSSGAFAFGDIFLLSSEYKGNPLSLSSSTAGFVAQATASSNLWSFDPTVSIASNAQYFFYTSSPASGVLGRYSSGVAGENHYFAFSGMNFNGPYLGVNFLLQGTSVPFVDPVPEPSTLTLLGIGLASLVILRRKRARQQTQ